MITDFFIKEVETTDTVEEIPMSDIISIDESDLEVSGIDFFTNESITCKITFYENPDVLDLLAADTIEDTEFLKYYFTFIKNGETRKYYIDRNSITWNKKDKEIQVRAEDLSGIVFDFIDVDKEFNDDNKDPVAKTISLINDILDDSILDSSLYSVNDNSVDMSLVDYTIYNPQADVDFDNQNPLLGDYRKDDYNLLWKWIGLNGSGELVFILYYTKVYLYQDQHDDAILYYKVVDEINLEAELINIEQDAFGEPEIPDDFAGINITGYQTHYETGGNEWDIEDNGYGVDLIYNGDTKITEISFADAETYNIKDTIKKYSFLNNIAIISDRDVNLNLETRFNENASVTDITDSDVIEYQVENTNWGDIDWEQELSDFSNNEKLASVITALYRSMRKKTTEKVDMEIMNNYDLNILDRINVFGNDFLIIAINIDNDNQIYTVEAWR